MRCAAYGMSVVILGERFTIRKLVRARQYSPGCRVRGSTLDGHMAIRPGWCAPSSSDSTQPALGNDAGSRNTMLRATVPEVQLVLAQAIHKKACHHSIYLVVRAQYSVRARYSVRAQYSVFWVGIYLFFSPNMFSVVNT